MSKKQLKITHEIISPFEELLVNEINGTFSFNPQNRNGEELSDFLSTCELLPSVSELIQQRDELLKTLQSLVLSMAAHPDCTEGSEFDDLSTIGQKLINKIKDNE